MKSQPQAVAFVQPHDKSGSSQITRFLHNSLKAERTRPIFPAESAPFHSHLLHSPPKPNLQMRYRQNKNILPFCCAFPSQGSQNHGYPGAATCICIWSTVGAGLHQRELGRDQGCASLLILQLTQPSAEGLGRSCSIPWRFW